MFRFRTYGINEWKDIEGVDEKWNYSIEAISNLFHVDRSGIGRHISNMYADRELKEISTCAKIAQVQLEGD